MKRKRLVLILFLITFDLVAVGGMVSIFAQENEQVNSNVEYAFGQAINFSIRVDDALDIEKISLFIQPELSTKIYVVDVPFVPGEIISVTYPVAVSTLDLQPYSELSYSWQLETSKGPIRVPELSFTYEDDRFVWQKMSQSAATAHWTGYGPFFGQDILDVVISAQERLAEILPLENITPFDIYIYPSTADLRAGLKLAGLAGDDSNHPELGIILATAVNQQTAVEELGQSIPYELSQLLLYRVSGDHYGKIPWWLKEGIAVSVQAKPHPRHEQILFEAVDQGATFPLWRLCNDPAEDTDRALLASAQSKSLVAFIQKTYGDQLFVDLISAYALGDECDVGVRRVLKTSLDDLEADWLSDYTPPSPVQDFILDYGLWFLLIGATIAFGITIILLSLRSRSHV